MNKRVLFVDDEPNVLDGLQRMLRPLRQEWEMEFVESGGAALEVLRDSHFDVVVSDMRMPGMTGDELLIEVMKRHPHVVRIILSGQSERDMIMKTVGAAHQFLAKPCDADLIKNTVIRACSLRDLLQSESIKSLVAQIDSLPSLPSLYAEIMRELQSPDTSIQKVGKIISEDVGMTAKILQLVNSAFFGLPRHVSSPAQAASLLGLDTVKALVLSVQIFSQFDQTKTHGFHLETLWRHSMVTGVYAKIIATAEEQERKMIDDSLMAGLLHDVGKLVLAANFPEKFSAAIALEAANGLSGWEAEREVIGHSHAEIGAYLLGLWGIPTPIVETLAFHHTPSICSADGFTPLTAVHVANCIENRGACGGQPKHDIEFDTEYLERLGLTERIPEWIKLCQITNGEEAEK